MITPSKHVDAIRSKAIAASWKNKRTAKARRARHHVKVAGHGEFRSVAAAFEALDLPMSKHIGFRMELKRDRKASFRHAGVSYSFTLVER